MTQEPRGGQNLVGDTVLELVDVTKQYPGNPPVRAVDRVSLHVSEGELLAIVGPSGSGKSTLLNLIGTLDRPDAGRLSIEGVDTASMSDAALAGLRARRIGFVFQQFHLMENLSAVANVATGLLYQGTLGKVRRKRATETCRRVGLGHRLHHTAAQLSGGERQRVAIARAIVSDPAIVLADEPTGNLDSRTSNEIVALLRQLNDEGSTILVITHDRDLAASFPRRIALNDGLVADDDSRPLLDSGVDRS